jgi:DNA polymerase-3 subunit delta
LVVLKDAESLPPSYRQGVFSYLQTPRQTSVFVIESTSPVIKGEFLLEISRYATLSYYRRLTDSDLNVWLSKKANLYGKKISIEAVRAIKENLPNDLMTLSSNMDSIILYIGKRSSITKEDVENVIGISPSHTAFDLIDTIARKDAKNALRIFAYLKKDKKRETELLGLLAWNARLLLRAKELLRIKDKLEVRRDLGLKPQVFGQLVQNASGFKRGEIFALLDEILKADVDIKTGMPPATVIERLIVKMCF